MSQIIDQAEALRQQAISLLMVERQTIDQKLAMLGADATSPVSSPSSPGRPRACGKCGLLGHNAKTCKETPGNTGADATPST
jgi:hypothetical protein